MTENEMREKIARLPIKNEWKANLLSGTHLLHWHPDFMMLEDDYLICVWDKGDEYKLTCLMYEDGCMSGWSLMNGERTGFLISSQPGSRAYWYDQLESLICEDELDLLESAT